MALLELGILFFFAPSLALPQGGFRIISFQTDNQGIKNVLKLRSVYSQPTFFPRRGLLFFMFPGLFLFSLLHSL